MKWGLQNVPQCVRNRVYSERKDVRGAAEKTDNAWCSATAPQLAGTFGTGASRHHAHRPCDQHHFYVPVIALKAGPAVPISFLLTTVVCCFIANTVSEFSRYMPSSGGYYSFAARGLGSRVGFMATSSYLIYDITGPAASSGFLGCLLSHTRRGHGW